MPQRPKLGEFIIATEAELTAMGLNSLSKGVNKMQAPSKIAEVKLPRRSKRAAKVHTLNERIKELTIQRTEHEFKLKSIKKKLAKYERELQDELDVVR